MEDSRRGTVEEQLLRQAENQTDALRNIQSAMMFLLALGILGAVLALAALFG